MPVNSTWTAECNLRLACLLSTWQLTSSMPFQLRSPAPTRTPTPLSPRSSKPTIRSSSTPPIFNSVTFLIKFSHFTASQAIQQALEHADHVHIIDHDIVQGIQWLGLFNILDCKLQKIKFILITSIRPSMRLLNSTCQLYKSSSTHLAFLPISSIWKAKLATQGSQSIGKLRLEKLLGCIGCTIACMTLQGVV